MPTPEEAPGSGIEPPHPRLAPYYLDETDRRRFVTAIFDETAPDYEHIIRWMSLGSGSWYRGDALRRAGLRPGMKVLDVAVGTGPVSERARRIVGPDGSVTGIDASFGMLSQTRKRLPIDVVQGLAERLPFRDGTFDFVSMGYALRHVADLRGTFAEYRRVLRPGGRLLVLDFCRARTSLGRAVNGFYLGKVVPWLAGRTSRSARADLLMEYCWETVERCVPPEAIAAAVAGAGFGELTTRTWFGAFIEYAAEAP